MSLVWREQLSVGNDPIDSDHKKLIAIINLVEDGLAQRDPQKMSEALNDLSMYSTLHFDHEERIAKAAGFKETIHLHQTHEDLIVRLEKFKQAAQGKWTQQSADAFCKLLHDWFINHVIKEDLKLRPLLERHSPKFDVR